MGVDERVAALRASDDGVPAARLARRLGLAVRRA
jgi:hypothetical protein